VRALPDASELHRFFGRVRTRLFLLRAVEGVAAGSVIGAALAALGALSPSLVGSVIVATGIVRTLLGDRWRFGWWRSNARLARDVERRTPTGRNLIVTAAELLESPRESSGYVPGLVVRRAAAMARELNPARIFPGRNAAAALAIAVVLLAGVLALPATDVGREDARLTRVPGLPGIERVDATVTPPSYSGLPATTLVNPSRIETLAGSRIQLSVAVEGADVLLETTSGTQQLSSSGGAYTATVIADADGYIALEPRDSAGTRGPRHLIGLAVTADRPPRVTMAAPGRDLFFSNVPATIPVAVNAEDDLALASLKLRYTAVSGSGERFTFIEREVPLTLATPNVRNWSATGTWRLDSLALAPGDLVVYRAVATDRRPGSAPVESDSYVLEVVTPGAIAAEGFAADDERDRYAVSQQMVILKTERLIARKASLPADSVADAARLLAAEQRQVRAEFVFMMGGELEDAALETAGTTELNEEAEAEAEGDILAGRLQNQGRIDMMRAIRSMSRASSALTEASLDQALRDERAALDNLMRAFSRTRFILRALTLRERIDLDRRLSGALLQTAGLSAPAASADPPARVAALRRLMADVSALAHDTARASATRAVDGALALLRSDPGSDTIRALAGRIQEVARQVVTRQAPRASEKVDSLVRELSLLAASSLPVAPMEPSSFDALRLAGAWRDRNRPGRQP
jgi:hypothetical protein